MKITKKTLQDRIEYLHNVTGEKFTLSCQCAGRGKGYSVLDNTGRHVMTFGHIPASELDACITAFAKGVLRSSLK